MKQGYSVVKEAGARERGRGPTAERTSDSGLCFTSWLCSLLLKKLTHSLSPYRGVLGCCLFQPCAILPNEECIN